MSYIDQSSDPRRRATAIASVAAIHAALGLAIVTGLSVAGFEPLKDERLSGFTVPLDPPPPPDPVPSPTEAVTSPPKAPAPSLAIPRPGPRADVFDPNDIVIPVIPRVVPSPSPSIAPSPTPSFAPKAPAPAGNPGGWISTDDYPSASIRRESEGTAGYRLVIGTDGKVDACEITASSGDAQLDQATCRLLGRRARFEPATDRSGARVVGTYNGQVHWRLIN